MKKLSIIGSAVAGIFIITITAFFVAPEEKSNVIVESVRRISGNLSQKCLDDARQGLSDPDSTRIVSFNKPEGKDYYLLKYKTRNPIGGYGYNDLSYDGSGKQVDRSSNTDSSGRKYVEYVSPSDQIIKKLKEETEALEQRNNELRKAKSTK